MLVQGRMSVERMCQLAPVSRAGYYRSLQEHSPVEQDMAVRAAIHQVVVEHRRRYGYRRVALELHKQGMQVNHKRVARMMREDNLLALQPRRFVVTSQARPGLEVALNLARRMQLTGVNQLWVADITYIQLWSEYVYLAVVLDAYSRMVVGWALGRRLNQELTLAALEMAIAQRQPPPGLVHHSDRGWQYTGPAYVALLEKQQMIASMSRPANPYDNAACESFMATLKREEIYVTVYLDLEHMRANIGQFIEQYYNRKRLHSALGYRSPEEFELAVEKQNQPLSLAATLTFFSPQARASTLVAGDGDSNAVPFPRPQPPAASDRKDGQ